LKHPLEHLDAKCWILIRHITREDEEWLWLRRLVRVCGSGVAKISRMSMSPKAVRDHLEHLSEHGIIEYEKGSVRRGGKRRFRLSPDHVWRERMQLEWCQRLHGLVQEALFYLGKRSLEEQLGQHDLSSDASLTKPRRPIKGRLFLEYSSKAYAEKEDLAYRAVKAQDMLLEIGWDYIKPRLVRFGVEVHPNRTMRDVGLTSSSPR